MGEQQTIRIKGETLHINFSMFGLIFTARQFLNAAKPVVEHERSEDGGWQPVGKYLACHSIELSLKAFLMLNGETLAGARQFSHRIAKLFAACEKQNLEGLVSLTDQERLEIQKADAYYNGKVFEYPFVFEAARASR